jgi:energy-coupling factor transporter ATP-binding protein EcfA2
MLDPGAAASLLQVIEELNERGVTIITVTHKMEEAARARRVLVMHAGRVAADGPPENTFTHPDLRAWSLRLPAVAALGRRVQPAFPRLPDFVPDAAALASMLTEMTTT